MRRFLFTLPTLALLFLVISGCNSELTEEQIIDKAAQIHEEVLTIDTHNDTPMRFRNPEFDMGEKHDPRKRGGKMDFPRMKEGGLDGAFFAVFTGQGARDDEGHTRAYERAANTFGNVHRMIEQNTDVATLALTADNAYEIEKEGKRAVFIGIENGYPIGKDIHKIKEFYDKGARYITLCHSRNNEICDSSTDRNGQEHGGLSGFGEEVVKEMNKLGIMIDVSHAHDESYWDIIETTEAPVIASHSCCWELCKHPRNLKDDMIAALKDNGGVLQVCVLTNFLIEPVENPERDAEEAELRQKYSNWEDLTPEEQDAGRAEFDAFRKKYPSKEATVKDIVDHIDHIVELAGIDHVGIGTDFDGGGGISDVYDVSEMGNITIELVRRGYSKKDIEKIWGGNIMRVMSEVETIAKTL